MACRRSAVRSRWAPPLKKGPRKRAFFVAGGIVGPMAALGWGAADPPPLGEGDHAKHGGGAREVFLSLDRKSTRLNSSHSCAPRMPSSACKKQRHIQNATSQMRRHA